MPSATRRNLTCGGWPRTLTDRPSSFTDRRRRAAQEGESDLGVLAAVRWHSYGSPEWDAVGRALYCADFLEPGRTYDPDGRAALAARYAEDPDDVLREVARIRVTWLVRSGWPIPEITWRFWNHLVGTR